MRRLFDNGTGTPWVGEDPQTEGCGDMSDLLSLRMVVVANSQRERDLLREGALMASMPIELAEHNGATGPGAIALGADVVLIDGSLADNDKAAAVKAAQGLKPAPVVLCVGGSRVDGTTGLVKKPTDPEGARVLADQCVRLCAPVRALVIDDSPTMRNIVKKILSGSRFKFMAEEAQEGIAGIAQLRTGKFDIAFLDYNMPGLNGLETLSEIRREMPKVAVVMITSTLDPAVADRARMAGALAFLKKPFYPADIDMIAERFFGLK